MLIALGPLPIHEQTAWRQQRIPEIGVVTEWAELSTSPPQGFPMLSEMRQWPNMVKRMCG